MKSFIAGLITFLIVGGGTLWLILATGGPAFGITWFTVIAALIISFTVANLTGGPAPAALISFVLIVGLFIAGDIAAAVVFAVAAVLLVVGMMRERRRLSEVEPEGFEMIPTHWLLEVVRPVSFVSRAKLLRGVEARDRSLLRSLYQSDATAESVAAHGSLEAAWTAEVDRRREKYLLEVAEAVAARRAARAGGGAS